MVNGGAIVASLPSSYGTRLERELRRRRLDGLDDRLVESSNLLDVANVVVTRALHHSRFGYELWLFRHRQFRRRMARMVRRQRHAGMAGECECTWKPLGLLVNGISIRRHHAECGPGPDRAGLSEQWEGT